MMISREQIGIRIVTIEGTEYTVWDDFIMRATFAQNTETKETKPVSSSGYISNELTTRKAIARRFGHKTFHK